MPGYLGIWHKAAQADRELKQLIGCRAPVVFHIACEAPWIESNPGMRTESTLIAGTLVYINTPPGLIRPVSAQHASVVLCGTRHHDKKEIAAAVARYVPESATRKWNQDERDALAVGLTCLWDLAHPVAGK